MAKNIFMQEKYLSLVFAGKKNQTIRKWKSCNLEAGEKFLFNFKYPAEIVSVHTKKISQLTTDEIKQDGFSSQDEFLTAIKEIYPNITTDDTVFVIKFKTK